MDTTNSATAIMAAPTRLETRVRKRVFISVSFSVVWNLSAVDRTGPSGILSNSGARFLSLVSGRGVGKNVGKTEQIRCNAGCAIDLLRRTESWAGGQKSLFMGAQGSRLWDRRAHTSLARTYRNDARTHPASSCCPSLVMPPASEIAAQWH